MLECRERVRVERAVGLRAHDPEQFVGAQGRPVRALGAERFGHVRDGQDPRGLVELRRRQPPVIAAPVQSFVVRGGNPGHVTEGRPRARASLGPQRRGTVITGASIVGGMVVGPRLVGPSAMAPLAIAASAVGALAIGRLAIADAVIRRLRTEELEVGSLKVGELQVAGQRWPSPQPPSIDA